MLLLTAFKFTVKALLTAELHVLGVSKQHTCSAGICFERDVLEFELQVMEKPEATLVLNQYCNIQNWAKTVPKWVQERFACRNHCKEKGGRGDGSHKHQYRCIVKLSVVLSKKVIAKLDIKCDKLRSTGCNS